MLHPRFQGQEPPRIPGRFTAAWNPGSLAGTSTQTLSFIEPLHATAFQFLQVGETDEATLCWGELDCRGTFTRSEWEQTVEANTGRDAGPGCGLIGAWLNPVCGATVPDCGADVTMQDEHASLGKAFCTVKTRETVGWARELLGGNSILLEENVGRFVADAEAIYSYEGTREIDTLIVGRASTGHSAFV